MSSSEGTALFGDTTRELWSVFRQHAGTTGTMQEQNVRILLNKLGLLPTKSQIHELVYVACECSGRTPVDHITFGEFSLLITELQEHYRKNAPAPHPRSQLRDRAVLALEERRKRRRLSVLRHHVIVFLGGSCNPTTWRHDTAIPFLKQHGITFYNPQVNDWKPELMEIEDQAKQSAEMLFFVVDNQTRSTASMVEAAYLAGCGRQLVLVIKFFQNPVIIQSETLSTTEVEDLERSHAYLTDLVERMGIPVFNDIGVALNCTCKAIQQDIKVIDLSLTDGAQPVKFPHVRIAEKLIKLKDVFTALDTNCTGRLNEEELRLAYKTITDEDLPLIATARFPDRMYNLEEFCLITAEYHHRRKSLLKRIMSSFAKFPSKVQDWLRGRPVSGRRLEPEPRRRDVFLGGTCGSSTWREDIAIPIFRKYGVSFFNPKLPEWSARYIPLEAAVKDTCQLLLYVVTADTRGITSLLEAGHFIGQCCNIVLCVQPLVGDSTMFGEKLSQTAIKDYNRGRAYLSDLANRDGVPVFADIEEAVMCSVQRLKGSSTRIAVQPH